MCCVQYLVAGGTAYMCCIQYLVAGGTAYTCTCCVQYLVAGCNHFFGGLRCTFTIIAMKVFLCGSFPSSLCFFFVLFLFFFFLYFFISFFLSFQYGPTDTSFLFSLASFGLFIMITFSYLTFFFDVFWDFILIGLVHP